MYNMNIANLWFFGINTQRLTFKVLEEKNTET